MNSKPFISRFTIVQERTTGRLGVIEETTSVDTSGPRNFHVVLEDTPAPCPPGKASYEASEVLTQFTPYNSRAKRFFLDLIQTRWWNEADEGSAQEE